MTERINNSQQLTDELLNEVTQILQDTDYSMAHFPVRYFFEQALMHSKNQWF